MYQQLCESIVTSLQGVEAAIVVSASHEPCHYSRNASFVDAILPTIGSIITKANELHLFKHSSGASLMVDTSFGALYIQVIDADNILVLCLLAEYSLHAVSATLQTLLPSTTVSQGKQL